MDISTLTFNVVPNDPSKPLGFEFWVNDQQITNIDAVSESASLRCEFDNEQEQTHQVKIVVKNKTADHTRVNEQGEIVQDSLLEIKNFKVDDFEIDQVVRTNAVYRHNFNGSQDWVDDKFYNTVGCNGTITFEFSTPSYLWLLENT